MPNIPSPLCKDNRRIMKHSRPLLVLQLLMLALVSFYQLVHLSKSDIVSNKPILDIPSATCSHQTKRYPAFNASTNKSFGACLIIMDDNHFLTEWLAYHFLQLPLRRLIVAIDPRSSTSPTDILDRYRNRGLMKITEWQEDDFMPPDMLALHASVQEGDWEQLKALYIERQFQFYTKCMAVLKHENITWTALTDTDEYILPNSNANLPFRLQNTENKTIFEIIESNRRNAPMIKNGCISMHRLQFGHKESSPSQVQHMVPEGFNGTDFLTLRYRHHAGLTNSEFNKIGKCMVNLSRAKPALDFHRSEVSSHRPIKRLCTETNMRIENQEAPFVLHHYTGSWEQWNYRNDFRPKRERENFDKIFFQNDQDDSIRPWLDSFVSRYGQDLADDLLEGVGKLI